MSKILIVVNTWPSKSHPYISQLFEYILETYQNVDFFVFKKGSLNIAYDHINKHNADKIFSRIEQRPKGLFDFSAYIDFCITLLFSPLKSINYILQEFKTNKSFKSVIVQFFFYNKILKKEYELVYLSSLQLALHFELKSIFKNAITLSSSRGQDFELFPKKYDLLIKKLDHIHVISKFLEEEIKSRHISEKKITRIEPAINLNWKGLSSVEDKSNSKIIIVSISRLEWIKGIIYAIRALKLCLDSLEYNRQKMEVEFQIVGSGSEEEQLKMEVYRLGLTKHVKFLGWKNREEIKLILAEAHICILLSLAEGFNNSIIEAQNNGCACIVSSSGGLPENIEDGLTGFVVDPFNVNSISQKLRTLILDDALRKKMGEAAMKRVEQNFSLDIHQSKFKGLFDKLLQSKNN